MRDISPPPSERVGRRQAATNQTQHPEVSGNGNGSEIDGDDLEKKSQPESTVPSGSSPPSVDCKSTKQVYAFYYAWFAGAEHGGWKGIEVSHGDRPAYGPYDSANEAKIIYDIQVAKQIGLNGFAIAWIGEHPADYGKNKPHHVLKILLQKAKEMGFCVAALFEAEMIYKQSWHERGFSNEYFDQHLECLPKQYVSH